MQPPSLLRTARALLRPHAVALVVAVTVQATQAQPSLTPEQLRRERQDFLAGMDRTVPMEIIEATRVQCATGEDVRAANRSRRLGVGQAPDSSDSCPTVLARIAREGDILGMYRDLVSQNGGQTDFYKDLPSAIGAAAMKPGTQAVAIGNGRAARLTSALAWDAGFTVAVQRREKLSPTLPGLAALKPISERCLDRAENDFGLCYTTGYVYGVRAAAGAPVRLE